MLDGEEEKTETTETSESSEETTAPEEAAV